MMRAFLTLALILGATRVVAGAEPLADRYLIDGRLAEGETALSEALQANPKDDQARFGLASVQYFRAVERLAQGLYKYGLNDRRARFLLRFPLPFPENPDPKTVKYSDLRPMLQTWIDDLERAEATLSQITDPDVKLPLHIALCRLDLDGDGQPEEESAAWRLYAQMDRRRGPGLSARMAEGFVIAFDRGDVAWLRGYCHLLMAMSEMMLAYDGHDLFEHCGHLVFARIETPYPFLNDRPIEDGDMPILDMIAAIHLMNFPLEEPQRMRKALEHLEAVIALSRESWKFILAETDNDHEWVPNPKQDTVMPNGRMTEEMVKGWMEFLDEAEAILKGETRVPFWRGGGDGEPRGVNLRRVFLEPRRFDLVLWVQGTAAMPYLEKGRTTSPETWRRFQRLFQGQFLGWATWIN